MTSSIDKTLILSGTIISSVFIFSTSLICLNESFLRRDKFINYDENHINKLIVLNGITVLFSGATFSYFVYKAIK